MKTALYLYIAAKVLFSSFVPKKIAVEISDRSACILKRFGPFFTPDSIDTAQCSCCRGFFPRNEIMAFHKYFDILSDPEYGSEFIISFLERTWYTKQSVAGVEHNFPMEMMFSHFLFMDYHFDGCKSCAISFQFLVLLFCGAQENLSWVPNRKKEENERLQAERSSNEVAPDI